MKEENWETRLQFEVMENYLLAAKLEYAARDKKAHMEEMRAHWDKLKDFIRAEIKSTREETIKEIREKIERYFAALQTRIPLPDPITTQDELLDTLTEKENP